MFSAFRIRRFPGVVTRQLRPTESVDAPTDTIDTYFSRLLKLIPSEVIAFYLVGRGVIPTGEKIPLLVWTIVGLIAVIVVRSLGTRDATTRRIQWMAVIIATISFAIWIYTLGDVFALYDVHVPYIGSLLVLTWTFFVPLFYKGD